MLAPLGIGVLYGKKEIAAKKSAEQIEEAMSRWQQKTFLKNTMEKK